MKNYLLVCLLIIAGVLNDTNAAVPNDLPQVPQELMLEAGTAAEEAGREWLEIIDKGDFEKSWNKSATYFQEVVPKADWIQSASSIRGTLGVVVSREVFTKKYMTSLPGAPDGEYVIIEFKTSFKNKDSAIETVASMRDKDGKWRVSGYFIK
jgi:hypothetical protein